MKIFVSAAEISSDLQAERILSELIRLYPNQKIEIAGIGGPKLRALANFKTIEQAENLRVMGFVEVLSRIFFIRKVLEKAVCFLVEFKPDLIITFDYPDFHFALMKRVNKIESLRNTIKICGIPPKVWVWRTKRIEKIKRLYDAVWVIFSFEEKLYRSHGIPVIYGGNPLISEIVNRTKNIQKDVWVKPEEVQLAVFPGSREAELRLHLPIIPLILGRVAQVTGRKIKAQVPVPKGVAIDSLRARLVSSNQIQFEFIEDGSAEVLARNSLGLIKSGTSTLEAVVLGCVPIIYYKVSPVTEWLFRNFVRYAGPIGLPNILIGDKSRTHLTFPEYIGAEATVETISSELISIIQNPARLKDLQEKGKGLRDDLCPYESVPAVVAARLHKWIKRPVGRNVKRESHLWIALASFAWSSLNFIRRALYSASILKVKVISGNSVLIGNLQAGGAGKTPLVITIAKEAVKRGQKVGVISRGYGGHRREPLLVVEANGENSHLLRNAQVLGDETVEVLSEVPEVVFCLSKDRTKAADALHQKGVNFLIFDDGFQNLKFKARKTVLALTDAAPSEVVYRDFYSAQKNADLIVNTKGRSRVGRDDAVVIDWEVDALPAQPIWLLCALADPSEVAQFYQNQGMTIQKMITRPDHSGWTTSEIDRLKREAEANGAVLAMTPKDAAKVDSVNLSSVFILKRKIKNLDWLEPLFTR